MRRALTGAVIILALAGSAAAVAAAPDNDDIIAAFPVRGGIGDTLSSRLLTVTVDSVRLADRLDVKYRDDAGSTTTDGVWVVVAATASASLDLETLTWTEIVIDGTHYRVSDVLPPLTPLLLPYGAGIPQYGQLVFELPISAVESPGAARAEIAFLPRFDPTLDSVPVVVVDLTALEVQSSIRIDEVTVVEP